MKSYLRKAGYSILVFILFLTTITAVNSEAVYANDDEVPTSEKVLINDGLENDDPESKQENDEESSENEEVELQPEVSIPSEIEEKPKSEEINSSKTEDSETTEDLETSEDYEVNFRSFRNIQAVTQNGWIEENNEKFYYEDGELITGWYEDTAGTWYYLKNDGSMATGNYEINGRLYVFSSEGEWQGSWRENNTGWWFKEADGSYPADQWRSLNNKMYYFDRSGYMETGWKQIDNTWYYLNPSGSRAIGWKQVDNKWYYLTPEGPMVTGNYEINNRLYVFSASGAWQGSWRENNTGRWFKRADGSYPANQWARLGDSWYHFDSKGYMETGWQKINNTWYYLNSDGSMATGWKLVNNTWYYLRPSGSMVTGSYKLSGRTYVFSTSGAWQGSWRENKTGWWFKQSDDSYPANQWKLLNNKWYYFNRSGYMATGWQKINNTWYYLNPGGSMATGWKKVNSKWYYLYASGAMAANTMIGQYKIGSDGAWIEQITVYLDPGHGSSDTGAYYGGIAERDINLKVSNKVASHLRKAGYNVIMSRETNKNSFSENSRTDLFARAEDANKLGADIFVSVHHNAMPWNSGVAGIETYYYSVESAHPPLPGNLDSHNDPARIASSRKLANAIHKEVVGSTKAIDRGVRSGAYVVVRETKMPAVLLELGYMSNPNELKKLTTDSYQNTLAASIFKGIDAYFN